MPSTKLLLPGCLHSLLQQSSPPHEIIVINNASTDRTAAAASIPGIRVVDEPRKELVIARETGRRVSTGDVLVYVDADCRAPRDWLERVARELSGPQPPAAVTGPYRFYDWDIIGRVHPCWVFTSARRYETMGRGKVFGLYVRNFCAEIFFHRPSDTPHEDVRA